MYIILCIRYNILHKNDDITNIINYGDNDYTMQLPISNNTVALIITDYNFQ